MLPECGFRIAPNCAKFGRMTMTSQFADMASSSSFFEVAMFFLYSLITGPSSMSVSSLVLELWQFSFIRDWSEIRKPDITPSDFCPVSGDKGDLGIPNLARMSRMKCYRMLKNVSYSFYRFWVIKGKPTGRVKSHMNSYDMIIQTLWTFCWYFDVFMTKKNFWNLMWCFSLTLK